MDSFEQFMKKRDETDKEIKAIILSNIKELGKKECGGYDGNIKCNTCGKTKSKTEMIWHTYKESWNCKEHRKI